MKMGKFMVVFWREGKFWVAKCLQNSVTSQGSSLQEVQDNIREALELTCEDSEQEYFEISDVQYKTLELC